ncbi:MAG TPA: TIR domain-containing protein [Phycisphaerae bacterium]|nr:TIR domain-containing protein [Phycisphaerae bacterium]HRW52157.1 TIR domain-containing protein [Phycisphaerae bacterium]
MVPTLYLCYEPDYRMIADRVDGYSVCPTNLDAYDARVDLSPDDPDAAPIRESLSAQIRTCDTLVCLIGQTTFLDPWVAWEIRTYLERPDRRGLVGIMLHDLNTPPADMIEKGSIFIKFKRDALEAAVDGAIGATDLSVDFVIDE